ncbi:ribonuclease P protein subunit Rpp29 [Staphylothermus marinus F1]|uniref:Ribonuclease P protein component 1 n=1 Tax=Staphylothermus marinus (strain ATCC 43588 / DSM 3639 / JCM 9404 / F1) TaxID=399550 RepID=RNP1_STAMF|nr:ribonuclease P protein subunit [Staphylothermus marinus]A3DNB5.1 RecName: Full=Ribonuclease P protein component 1; Short=RNase P component 1; AltName: Full=Rpp29 [Staphylothermus marinus F1]ABN70125.1 ribonuclease P protein subunit Rpp29 [Staphylothermus marinus F1]
MRHTRRNIFYHELIGLRIKIIEYPDKSLVGLTGLVIDETQKTLLIETNSGRRVRVLKANGVFQFMLPNKEKVIIRGVQILGRPEDRLKNIVR